MSKGTIEIDGSQGEGGGQILRTSLALSLITGKSFHLRNVRAGRAKPGLQAQHLMSVKAAAQIGQAKLRGASLGSINLTFEPGAVKAGEYHFAIGTAGAASLVLHTIYLPLALASAESRVTIEGGTHVKASPCWQFLDRTWSAYLRSLALQVDVKLERCGFYPRGGGAITARIQQVQTIRAFHGLQSESIRKAKVLSAIAGLPTHVADRQTHRATAGLAALGLEVEHVHERWQGGPGCMLGIELPTEPVPTFFFSLGEKGKPAETVAEEAVAQVVAYLRCQPPAVDEHSADQIVLPLALAEGKSQFRVAHVSSHLRTNVDVIQHFLDRPIRHEQQDDGGIVTIG